MKRKITYLSAIGAIVLSACGGGSGSSSSPTPLAPEVGSISGTVSISNVYLPASLTSISAADVHGIEKNTADSSFNNEPQQCVASEIVVGFRAGADAGAALTDILKRYEDVQLRDAGFLYPNGPRRLRTSAYANLTLSELNAKKATQDVVRRLRSEPLLDYVELNGIRTTQGMPNDKAFAFGLQWDMNLINLPAAWEITTGNSQVVVAVLDTGIRSHPDLNSNVLDTGYDFVANDADPTEPLTPLASFHGTHVAGTIAAVGNNNSGIAGVAWGVKVLPIRVLGALGGTDAAILNGLLYAAGLPNSSGKVPPRHANVINMSLGGLQTCSPSYQAVINQVLASGVVIVAAAGNDGEATKPSLPASCQGVISVAAVDPQARLASYSNYQSYVTIAAPGGELGHGIHNAIFSTLPSSDVGQPSYKFMQGTSMAAPHVAGVVALMLSINPSLTPAQVRAILVSNAASIITARNSGATQIRVSPAFGLVDAGAVIATVAGQNVSAAIPYPFPAAAAFNQITVPMQMPILIVNAGNSTLSVTGLTCGTGETASNCAAGQLWLSAAVDGTCGAIASGAYCSATITVDPTSLANNEQYVGLVVLNTNGGEVAVPVYFQLGDLPSTASIGPLSVQLWSINPQTDKLNKKVSETSITAVPSTSAVEFSFSSVPVGQYAVVAGVDKNGNGVFGDAAGETQIIAPYPISQISVSANQQTTIDLEIRNEPDSIVNGL